MYISTFECKNPRLLKNADLIHKAIMMKFENKRSSENVLFMVMNGNLVVQSNEKPSDAMSDSFKLLHSRNCDFLINSIKTGDIIQLYGIFEPTVRRFGRNYVLTSMDKRMEWVDRKFINAANVLEKNEKTKEKIFIEKTSGDKRTTFFYGYELLIQVTDASEFKRRFLSGFGRSKSYGAGMCIIVNIEHKIPD